MEHSPNRGGGLKIIAAILDQPVIEKIDFEHDGVPHSLQFHWVVHDGKERGTDMHYTHSLGRGLVSLDDDQRGAASRMAGRVKAGLAASFPRPRLQRPRGAWERAGV